MPPGTERLEELLSENLSVAKENNRLLKAMRRDAWIGLIVKVFLWLLILGVPLFFLSSYIGPLMDALSGNATTTEEGGLAPGLFGIPSEEQIQQLIEEYQTQYQ